MLGFFPVRLDLEEHSEFLVGLTAEQIAGDTEREILRANKGAISDKVAGVTFDEGFHVSTDFLALALAKRVLDRLDARWMRERRTEAGSG